MTLGKASTSRWSRGLFGLAAAALLAAPSLAHPAAAAPAGSTALVAISPASQTHNAGTPFTYSIAVSCQGVAGSSCGPDVTLTIPIDTSTKPSMATWAFAASSGTAGLITAGPTVVGDELHLTLNAATFEAGYSGTVRLTVTPPNHVTHDDTSFDLLPTLSGGSIPDVTAPTPATATVTAKPLVSVAKATSDGGSVYEDLATIGFTITAKCSPNSAGDLYIATGQIVDYLPADLTYVSSKPAGGVYDPGTHSVTWDLDKAKPDEMPPGCSANATGPSTYKVVTTAPASAPSPPLLTNEVDFSGTGPSATNPAGVTSTTSATVNVQIVDTPPIGPGAGYASVSKTALAPLAQPGISSGNQYVATYPGSWIPVAKSPKYQVGAAPASYRTQVTYGLVGRYMTDYYDPLPCLDNVAGNVYSSPSYTAPACANPAFHLEVFSVTSTGADPDVEGLGQAYDNGWRPKIILADGSVHQLNANAAVKPTDATAFFTVPAGASVATVRLPPDPLLKNKSIVLTHWGYADASLATVNGGLNQLHNTATAVPELVAGTPLTPVSRSADLFTVPKQVGLGVAKSFGGLGQASGGHTALVITGAVTTPTPLVRDVVLTDLLPSSIHWENDVSSMTVKVAFNAGASSQNVTAQVEYLTNYEFSGRDLIRITVPHAAFDTPGSYVVTLPTNALLVTTPKALGIYVNTDQIFLHGLAPEQIFETCTTPTQSGGGVSSATFQSDNAMDLAGDGNLSEDYCQNTAQLRVSGSGAAFALTKTVQGDLDAIPRGPLGIGNATAAGTGTYVLGWTNVGSDTLKQPVIYDIFAYVGDTGVSEGQSTKPRDSGFATVLKSIGTLPSGVSVEYSESTNPCRDEVFPNATNPTCVNDWTASPASLDAVKAVRFTSSSTYAAGQGFEVSVEISLPPAALNKVAWNSAATNALDDTDPSTQTLPAEPPKVGIKATSPPRFTTEVNHELATPGQAVEDTVKLRGVGSSTVDVTWSLVGPVDPVAGSCSGVDWTAAAVVKTETDSFVDGDGDYVVGPARVGPVGCYSFTYSLTDADYDPNPIVMDAGADHEVILVAPFAPRISTVAHHETATATSQLLSDEVQLSGSGLSASKTASMAWTLHGPLPAVAGSCAGVSWTAAPSAASGTMSLSGDGTYVTPQVAVKAAGCYSFSESVAKGEGRLAVATAPGDPAETVLLEGSGDGGLAVTGGALWAPLLLGLALLGVGVALRRRARR
mgnify:CR=1 FL=1